MVDKKRRFYRLVEDSLDNFRKVVSNVKGVFNSCLDPTYVQAFLRTMAVRKVLRSPAVLKDRNGFQYIFFPEEHIFSLFHTGYFGYPEIAEQEFSRKVLQKNMTVVDVGAHIGQFTMLFASLVGPSGRVFAFEPCSSTMRRLRTHTILNGFDNIVTEQLAVGSEHEGFANLNVFPRGYTVWNTVGNPKMFSRDDPGKRVVTIYQETVPTMTIDHYCNDHGIEFIDYLKVDVEGAEFDVLKGCSGLLEKKAIRYVQFEVSKAMLEGMGRDGSEIFELLNNFGYESHPLSVNGDLLSPVKMSEGFFANFIAKSNDIITGQ